MIPRVRYKNNCRFRLVSPSGIECYKTFINRVRVWKFGVYYKGRKSKSYHYCSTVPLHVMMDGCGSTSAPLCIGCKAWIVVRECCFNSDLRHVAVDVIVDLRHVAVDVILVFVTCSTSGNV